MKTKKQEDRWINIHDDDAMRAAGLPRPTIQSSRDPEVWSKTFKEKKELTKVKHMYKKKDMHFKTLPLKEIPVRCKLIINLYKNKVFNKSTYSIECLQHQIPRILSRFKVSSKDIVKNYSWNGRTYSTKVLPFWN